MKHIDLFSGIGGFSLALDRVFPDVEHTFCEIDPFCQEVLKKHWPNSKIHEDIRTLTADTQHNGIIRTEETGTDSRTQSESPSGQELSLNESTGNDSIRKEKPRWDFLTGGFPCQPFSQAGRRKGTEDDRHLWPEMLRVIREFSPVWVIGENVGGFVTWNDGMVLRQVFSDLEGEGYEVQAFIIPAVSKNAPHRRDRIWIVANSRSTESGGLSSGKREEISKTGEANINAPHTRQQYGSKGNKQRMDSETGWGENWLEVATRLCRVDDGIPRRLDRNPRLKALGNAIVPQVAEEIFKAIRGL